MKRPKLYVLFICCFLSLQTSVYGQGLQWVRSFSVDEPTAVSADIRADVFLATTLGEIKKYSPAGKLLNTYSPQSASTFTMLEADRGMQVLAFDEDNQQLLFLDRFLNLMGQTRLPARDFGFISAITSSPNNTFWIVDVSSRQLKQWQADTQQLLQNKNLNQLIGSQSIEFKSLRYYQHKLYLFADSKLYIFDQLGNFEQELSLPAWRSISFRGNGLLLLSPGGSLFAISLINGRQQPLNVPADKKYEFVLNVQDDIYLFYHQEADVYRMLP